MARSGNTHAIGSRLTLHASTGTYLREIRSSSGFLSGDPSRVHFGFPEDAALQRLEITCPTAPAPPCDAPADTLLTVQR